MVNAGGGLIIIGVAEDASARPASAPGVEVSDDAIRRIRQIVASHVVPLPTFDVIGIQRDPASDHGFVVIATAQSVLAPHAVAVNDGYKYPVRNGATTRYLSEPEIAAAYRRREIGAVERAGRTATVEADLIQRLDLSEDAWLLVSLTPELPGSFPVSSTGYQALQGAVASCGLRLLDGSESGLRLSWVAPERYIATADLGESETFGYRAAELYSDGTGLVAVRLWNVRRSRPRQDEDDRSQLLDMDVVADYLLGMTRFLAAYAAKFARVQGTALVQATVVPSTGASFTYIGKDRGFYGDRSRPVSGPTLPATAILDVDAASEVTMGLVSAVALLHRGVGHAFGLPELSNFTIDGKIALQAWSEALRGEVKQLAEAAGLMMV